MHIGNNKNVLKKVRSFTQSKEGTYDFKTGDWVEYGEGFQVSFVREEAFTTLSIQGWDIITNYLCAYLNSIAYIGVYGGKPEVSFHAIDKSKGEDVMKIYNQESMLDWEKKMKYPKSDEHWYIYNRFYDEEKRVNYEEILETVL